MISRGNATGAVATRVDKVVALLLQVAVMAATRDFDLHALDRRLLYRWSSGRRVAADSEPRIDKQYAKMAQSPDA